MTSESDISQKAINQAHWESKIPINDGLRDIIDPLTNQFSQEVIWAIRNDRSDVNPETIKGSGVTYTMPYGRINALPPALFGNISKHDISLERELVVPKDDDEIYAFVDKYIAWAQKTTAGNRHDVWGYPTRESIIRGVQNLKGMEYPLDAWQMAAEQMQQSLQNDNVFLLDVARGNRIGNAALDYDQLNPVAAAIHKSHESHVVAISTLAPNGDTMISQTREIAQMPIGQYGYDAAEKLARVTVGLNDILKTSPVIDCGVRLRLESKDKDALAVHTARSRERYEAGTRDFAVHGVKNTLAEGILSMSQVIAFLTAEKIEGYDTHDQLVEAILDSDVIEQFTRLVRPGYIGPATLAGLYMPGALIVKNGNLRLSSEIVQELNSARKKYVTEMVAKWAMHDTDPENVESPAVLAVTCPAAAPKGSITTLKSVFKEFYRTDSHQ